MLASSDFIAFNKKKPLLTTPDLATDAKVRNFQRPKLKWLSFRDVTHLTSADPADCPLALIGAGERSQLQFAVSLPDSSGEGEGGEFYSSRSALFILRRRESEIMAKALSLLNWSLRTNFCSSCGKPLNNRLSGLSKSCTGCQHVYYASCAAVAITMVTNVNNDACLLVRQARHPPGMFSCVAGFLEPGDSIETCVQREVAEEVGLSVENVKYSKSQHWPFQGGSLMIGCHAQTQQTQLDVDQTEIEDARWFDRQEVEAALERSLNISNYDWSDQMDPPALWVPPRGAIAHELIKSWLTSSSNR